MNQAEQEQVERVRKKIENLVTVIWEAGGEYMPETFKEFLKKYTDQILSIDGLLIKSDDQSKPENPFAKQADAGDMHALSRTSGYYCAQDDMSDFVRVIKEKVDGR